jgi:hypothetical protein
MKSCCRFVQRDWREPHSGTEGEVQGGDFGARGGSEARFVVRVLSGGYRARSRLVLTAGRETLLGQTKYKKDCLVGAIQPVDFESIIDFRRIDWQRYLVR